MKVESDAASWPEHGWVWASDFVDWDLYLRGWTFLHHTEFAQAGKQTKGRSRLSLHGTVRAVWSGCSSKPSNCNASR